MMDHGYDALVETLWKDLDGRVARQQITNAVCEIAAGFEQATVKAYVPIFVRRQALDLQGRVIGVNSQIISPSGASSGIGFAVSANTVGRVVSELIAQGYYAHPWLGADMVALSTSVTRMLQDAGVDVSTDSGLLVLDTEADGPADEAGLQGGTQWARLGRYQLPVGGDIITAVDDQPVEDFQALTVYLETEATVGDTVELTVLRDGTQITIPVILGEEPQV